MLEERLSKAYSQQSLGGYNLPPRQPSGPYPSISAQAHGNAGGAENFYTGQPTNFPVHPNQPQFATYGPGLGPHPGQAPPQQQAQRSDAWQAGVPPGIQDPYQQQPPVDATQRMQTPQQRNVSPSADRRGSYYFNPPSSAQSPSAPSAPGSAPDANASPYPNLQQMQYQSVPATPSQPTPMQPSQPSQPSQQPPQPPQPPQFQQAPPQQQAQQQPPYWQASVPQQPAPQQAPQQPPAAPQSWAYTGYTQDSFPSVPQNDPIKKPVAEEALIEL